MYIHYKQSGTPNSPALLFAHSLGADLHMWDDVVPFLLPYFKVIQYDIRDHGQSEGKHETYTIAVLGKDVISLMDQLEIKEAYFCGLSIGGLIAQYLGIYHSDRIKKIIIANSASKIGNDEKWNSRIEAVSKNGLKALVDETMQRWFSENYFHQNPDKINYIRNSFVNINAAGYNKCCAAIRDSDFSNIINQIPISALIITGNQDPVTTVEDAEYLVRNIKNAELEILAAKHLSATELPQLFATRLIDFIVGRI